MEFGVNESATSPSAHGTNTVEPIQAVPPKAPEHTGLLVTSPPMPPSWSAFSRYAMPCLPAARTTPIDGSSVAPSEPRSASLALSDFQVEGAKYDCTCKSGDSLTTELP